MDKNKYKALISNFSEVEFKDNYPLSSLNSFKTGGSTDLFASISSMDLLIKLISYLNLSKIKYIVVGSGTNLVFSDTGFKGLVIKNNCRNFSISNNGYLIAESGSISNQVVSYLIKNNYQGLEKLYGIPGTLGGAIHNNANFPKDNYLFENFVYKVDILKEDNSIVQVDKDYLNFKFDSSVLQQNNNLVLKLYIPINKSNKLNIAEIYQQALIYRKNTQPKNIAHGVVFRNIFLDYTESDKYNSDNLGMDILFKNENFFTDLSAKVSFYNLNPRYILNNGSATSTDLLVFLEKVINLVYNKYKIRMNIKNYIVN